MTHFVAAAAVGLAALAAAAMGPATRAGAVVLDDFNRPDSATLGPQWTQQAGTESVSGDAATGSPSSLATYNGVSSQDISFDASLPTGGSGSVAGVLDYSSAGDYYIILENGKGSSKFNYVAFEYGDNQLDGGQTGYSFKIAQPFSAGHVDMSLSGETATVSLTQAGGSAQTYSYTYQQAMTGTGIGLGFYGSGAADNFAAVPAAGGGGGPEPSTWALMMVGVFGAGAALRRGKGAAGAALAV